MPLLKQETKQVRQMVGITMSNDALPAKKKPFKAYSQVYPEGEWRYTMLFLPSITCVVAPVGPKYKKKKRKKRKRAHLLQT